MTDESTPTNEMIIKTEGVDLWYGPVQALKHVDIPIHARQVTALIGPSGCGKSTLLRCFNRMNDLVPDCRVEGAILYHGANIHDPSCDVVELRETGRHGLPEAEPVPEVDLREHRLRPPRPRREEPGRPSHEIVEPSLRKAALWDEVKDRQEESALGLSGGQQQRLCIARTLAVEPEVILMDEPCSALDPIATAKIEDLIDDLKKNYTVDHRDPQHAAGCPRQRLYRVHVPRRTDRVRRDPPDLREAQGGTDRTLYLGAVRMTEKFEAELEVLLRETLEMGELSQAMFCDSIDALVSRDTVLAAHVIAKKEELHDRLTRTEDRAYAESSPSTSRWPGTSGPWSPA